MHELRVPVAEDIPRQRALILTDYALTEIDVTALEPTRRLTEGIGKNNTYLRCDGDDVVAVGNASAVMGLWCRYHR